MPTFDGETSQDRQLWQTYLFWARERALSRDDRDLRPAIVDDPNRRVSPEVSNALQLILFSAFVLEYRMKRVLSCMQARLRDSDNLSILVQNFWKRLNKKGRLDSKGTCAPPGDWQNIEDIVGKLADLRNDIAHADYEDVLEFLSRRGEPVPTSQRYYNAVIDAIRLINEGTGYDDRSTADLRSYFDPLKVPSLGD